jgi:hypothetical protein
VGSDCCVSVFDTAGNAIWTRTWDGPDHLEDEVSALGIDSIGNIHVAGHTTIHSTPNGHARAVALEYDPDGALRYEYVHPSSAGAQGLAYIIDLALGPGSTVSLAGVDDGPASSNGDMLLIRLERTSVPYCFGDGSGTACPCNNASGSIEQSGCASSLGLGARLIDSGASSLAADTLVLNGSSLPNSSCLYFQGTLATAGGAGAVFGDGLRCSSGTVVRLSAKTNSNGASRFPSAGDPPVSVRGGVAAIGQRTYQVWYRNAAAFCTSSTFNLTNGLRVTWIP